MRSVVCRELDVPESVVLEESPPGPLDPSEVRVRVTAAGVNYVDGLFVQGLYQIRPEPPFTPGSELAGVVEAVGADVDSWAPGDRVMASVGLGAFCSEIDLHPNRLVGVPESISDTRAATLGQSYATAWFALTRRAMAREGESIVVLGAAGGVGLATLDVARSLGLFTVAAASTRSKLDLCIQRGAHEVIDYSTEDLKTRARELTGGGADIVFDPVGGDNTEAGLRSLREFGRLVVIGFASGAIPALPANQVLLRNRSVLGVDWGAWALGNPELNAALMQEVLAAVDRGELDPVEPETRPLSEAGAAMRDLFERRVAGKLCLVPGN